MLQAEGLTMTNVGHGRLRVRYVKEPFFKRAQRKAWSKARDPVRRAKIAAAKLGIPRPPEVVAKMAASKRGSRHSEATRRKMSLSHEKQWLRAPLSRRRWTAQEDAYVRDLRPAEVAE